MEETDRANAASSAKATADLIIHMGKVRRGEAPATVTAGPKNFTKFTPEEILAAGRKARGESTK